MYCDILQKSMIPSLRRLGCRAVFRHDNDPKHTSKTTTVLLKKLRVKVICGASSNRRWRSARSLASTSSVMSSWMSGRGLQWQPVKIWWTPCPRGLRQCWEIMVATQNIDTLGPIWTFSLRGVLTFVANVHCYTSCTLTTLHCSRVSFLQCCHMKKYKKIFTQMWGVYSLLWDTVYQVFIVHLSIIIVLHCIICFTPQFYVSSVILLYKYLTSDQNLILLFWSYKYQHRQQTA